MFFLHFTRPLWMGCRYCQNHFGCWTHHHPHPNLQVSGGMLQLWTRAHHVPVLGWTFHHYAMNRCWCPPSLLPHILLIAAPKTRDNKAKKKRKRKCFASAVCLPPRLPFLQLKTFSPVCICPSHQAISLFLPPLSFIYPPPPKLSLSHAPTFPPAQPQQCCTSG